MPLAVARHALDMQNPAPNDRGPAVVGRRLGQQPGSATLGDRPRKVSSDPGGKPLPDVSHQAIALLPPFYGQPVTKVGHALKEQPEAHAPGRGFGRFNNV